MPIDPLVLGLVLGAVLGTVAGFSVRGITTTVKDCYRSTQSWPITTVVADDLDAARALLDSYAARLEAAHTAALSDDTKRLLIGILQAPLAGTSVDEGDLPMLSATLRALAMQVVPSARPDEHTPRQR